MNATSMRYVFSGISAGFLLAMIGVFLIEGDSNGAGFYACLAFVSAIMAMTPIHRLETFYTQFKCKHSYVDNDQMGWVYFECEHCGKIIEKAKQ